MQSTIDKVKAEVKRHRITSFRASDITCDKDSLCVLGAYKASDSQTVMDAIGIRKNLTKDIFSKPAENWSTIQTALNGINKTKRFGCIVKDDGTLVQVLRSVNPEEVELNFDDRIDKLIDVIVSDNTKRLHSVTFDGASGAVNVNVANLSQIDVGQGDLWNFGTAVDISYGKQQFSNYYLRLVCSNGLKTREQIASRIVRESTAIDKQFVRFSGNEDAIRYIVPRVNKMREHAASFHELKTIADALPDKLAIASVFPEYESVVNDYAAHGMQIVDMPAQQQRRVYTDQNLYNVFNKATNLATHWADAGSAVHNALNKAASDIFVKGPDLSVETINIYKK